MFDCILTHPTQVCHHHNRVPWRLATELSVEWQIVVYFTCILWISKSWKKYMVHKFRSLVIWTALIISFVLVEEGQRYFSLIDILLVLEILLNDLVIQSMLIFPIKTRISIGISSGPNAPFFSILGKTVFPTNLEVSSVILWFGSKLWYLDTFISPAYLYRYDTCIDTRYYTHTFRVQV